MKFLLFALVSLFAAPAHAEMFTEGDWKIASFHIGEGVGAWGKDEAGALLRKRVSFRRDGIVLAGKACAGTVKAVGLAEAKSLTEGMDGRYCGRGRVKPEVHSISLSCGDKARFTPYAVRLSNGDYLGFGDGVTFCLSR